MPARLSALALRGVLLLAGLLPAACGLPPNTAVGDWSRSASIATDRPSLAGSPQAAATRAMQEALATYFYALGILWDEAEFSFQAAEFGPLAARATGFDPAAGAAILRLGDNLQAASADRPMQWMPRDNSSPRPLPEDWRLVNLIAASDAPVQLLLAALARAVQPVPEPALRLPAAASTDPVLQQLQREDAEAQQQAQAATAAARQAYARMLPEIGAGHAALKAQGRLITQREVERQVFLADDRLRRATAALPREAPRPTPAALAAIRAP